jgi:hypothetical protein
LRTKSVEQEIEIPQEAPVETPVEVKEVNIQQESQQITNELKPEEEINVRAWASPELLKEEGVLETPPNN